MTWNIERRKLQIVSNKLELFMHIFFYPCLDAFSVEMFE